METIKIHPVNHTDTLQHLKLLIYQAIEWAPFQQNLFLGEKYVVHEFS